MRIRIVANGMRLLIPVPFGMADLAVRLVPEAVFENLRNRAPASCNGLISRQMLMLICRACREMRKEYGNLELIRVEASDGTFVSVRL